MKHTRKSRRLKRQRRRSSRSSRSSRSGRSRSGRRSSNGGNTDLLLKYQNQYNDLSFKFLETPITRIQPTIIR